MDIHIEPVVSQIRMYSEGNSYEARSRYETVATLLHIDDDTVCIKGLLGKLDKGTIEDLYRLLYLRGYSSLLMTRHGVNKTVNLPKYFKA